MKIAILIGAALLGATGVAAAPAEAQRYGYNHRYDRGWHGGNRWRGGPRWHGNRGYYRGGYGWNRGRRWGGSRLVCRTRPGYYGPVRRCFRVYR